MSLGPNSSPLQPPGSMGWEHSVTGARENSQVEKGGCDSDQKSVERDKERIAADENKTSSIIRM
jgi:hypothetical protein